MVLKFVILLAVVSAVTARPGFLAEAPLSYASHYGSHYYGGDYDFGHSHHDFGHTHHVIPPAVSYQSSTVYHTKPVKVITPVVTPIVKTIATPVLSVPHYAGFDGIHDSYDDHGLYGGYGGWKGWY